MIRIVYFIIFLLISHSAWSQCSPLSERDYQTAKRRVVMTQGGHNAYQSALDIARIHCLSSNQAKDLASYLANDRDKFDFLKQAFPNIIDKENFTDVLDVFRNFSNAFRLYHITLGSAPNNPPHTPPSTNPNCNQPMTIRDFQSMMSRLQSTADDRGKATYILNQVPNYCLSIQQVSQAVTTLRDENIRLDILKRLAPYIVEPTGYERLGDMLSSAAKADFLRFLQNPNLQNNNQPIGCQMTDIEFDNFLKSVESQSFDKDKVNHISTNMRSRCLTASQIKKLVKTSSFDASRLEIAKTLFETCVDKQNYYTVVDEMSFSSSKNDLNDFIKSRM